MVLGKLPVPGDVLIIWSILGQGPAALAVGADGDCLAIILLYIISLLIPSLWEMARYRQNYCLKGPLSPKQPTNQKRLWRMNSSGLRRSSVLAAVSQEEKCEFKKIENLRGKNGERKS